MSTKNARILGIRLDSIDAERVKRFEDTTHIEGVSLARAALKAALARFEETGSLSLPLRVVEDAAQAPAKPFKITKIIGPDPLNPTEAEKKASVVNDAPSEAPELASNRLQRQLDAVTKRGAHAR